MAEPLPLFYAHRHVLSTFHHTGQAQGTRALCCWLPLPPTPLTPHTPYPAHKPPSSSLPSHQPHAIARALLPSVRGYAVACTIPLACFPKPSICTVCIHTGRQWVVSPSPPPPCCLPPQPTSCTQRIQSPYAKAFLCTARRCCSKHACCACRSSLSQSARALQHHPFQHTPPMPLIPPKPPLCLPIGRPAGQVCTLT